MQDTSKKESQTHSKMTAGSELREILEVCREFKVEQIWYGDLKVRFQGNDGPLPILDPMSASKKIQAGQPDFDKQMPTDDELLGWSTGVELTPEAKEAMK